MSQSSDPEQPARPENAVVRFLRWLIEPVGPQPPAMNVLRWTLRIVAMLCYGELISDIGGGESGNAGVGRSARKPVQPPPNT